MPLSSPYDFITKDDQLMNYIFSSMKQPSFNAMGGGKYRLPSGVEVPKVKLPDVQLPEIKGPDLGIKAPELKLPSLNLPNVDLPNIGLPSIQLPKIDLPKLDLPQVPLPSAGGLGYDLKTGQVTYKPTPGQAIQTAADIAKIGGQEGLSSGLGQVGSVLSDFAGPIAWLTSAMKGVEGVQRNEAEAKEKLRLDNAATALLGPAKYSGVRPQEDAELQLKRRALMSYLEANPMADEAARNLLSGADLSSMSIDEIIKQIDIAAPKQAPARRTSGAVQVVKI